MFICLKINFLVLQKNKKHKNKLQQNNFISVIYIFTDCLGPLHVGDTLSVYMVYIIPKIEKHLSCIIACCMAHQSQKQVYKF